jgi:hypothetical protein
LTAVLAAALAFGACSSGSHRSEAITPQAANALCRSHLADAGAGARLQTAIARSAAATVTHMQDIGQRAAPWNGVSADELIAECRYTFPAGPNHPVVRCGPDVVVPAGSTTAYFYDEHGHRSVLQLGRGASGTQCGGAAKP